MKHTVCTDVFSQTVRKSYYKKQQRIKLFVLKLLNSMHATYEPYLKKKKKSAVGYEITSHYFLKYFYIMFKTFMFDATALYNLGLDTSFW